MAEKCIKLGKETAAMLTEDLISEILVRLPVIPLLRFRCVCKAWYRLIKSPNFIDKHLEHSLSNPDSILVSHTEGTVKFLSLHDYESLDFIATYEMDDLDRFIQICGPCHGLLCLMDSKRELELYNPSTGEYLRLPLRPFPCPNDWKCYRMCFGFGFVSNPKDYKVFSLINYYREYISDSDDDDEDTEGEENENVEDNQPNYKVEIYDLSTDSWREIGCNFPYLMYGDEYGILFNGSLHWTARREATNIILCFDMIYEVFRDMEVHDDLQWKDGIYRSLTVLNDSLALFAYTMNYHNPGEQFVEIWVMKEYGVAESWTKQFSIGPLSGINRPHMLWKNKAILLESMGGQLLSCALDTHEIKELEIQGVRGNMRVMVFEESLITLNPLNEESKRSL